MALPWVHLDEASISAHQTDFLNNILYQLSDSGSCEPLVVFILPNPIILNVPLIVRIVPLIVHNIYIFFYRFICLMGGN
jgi:hypothetical protein